MNIINDLNWRYAVKMFSDKKVSEQDITSLREAIRLTPSAYGLQPYKVIIIESEKLKKALLPYSYGQDKVVNCSHLFVFAAETSSAEQIVNRYIDTHAKINSMATAMLSKMATQMKEALGSMGDAQRIQWAHQQVFIALGNFLTCVASMRIDACPMGGFEAEGFDKVLRLNKQSLTTSAICPIGYRHPDDRNAYKSKVRLESTTLFENR